MTGPASAGIRAWIDGASRGNPGESGFGVVAHRDGAVEEIGGFLGRTTNNVAEYAALVAALTFARNEGAASLELFSDSQLLVRQVSGQYRVKAPHLVPIYLKVMELKRGIPRVKVEHVRRGDNKAADALANRAIDQRMPMLEWLELELPVG